MIAGDCGKCRLSGIVAFRPEFRQSKTSVRRPHHDNLQNLMAASKPRDVNDEPMGLLFPVIRSPFQQQSSVPCVEDDLAE